jgi:hypothetical protein
LSKTVRGREKNSNIFEIRKLKYVCILNFKKNGTVLYKSKFEIQSRITRKVEMLETFSITYSFFSGYSEKESIMKKFWFPKLHCFSWQVQVTKTPRNRVRGLGDGPIMVNKNIINSKNFTTNYENLLFCSNASLKFWFINWIFLEIYDIEKN